ncbi:MAG: hypothetical protein WA672_12320 [Candidatus Angelobacter sp.]
MGIAIGLEVLANWICFLVLLSKAQTPYGEMFQTSYVTGGLLLLSCFALVASMAARTARRTLSLANALLITLWVVIAYAPAHWLKKADFGSVEVDERPVPAVIYIGNPTDMEAEAIALVHVPAASDYFLSFGEERIRLAGQSEYVRLPGGIWCLRSMRDLAFTEPLPFRHTNEFRIASPKGEVISVQF